MNDLGWLDLFWKRLTELCAEQRNLVDEELSRRLITGLAIQNEFMTEIGAACRYARQNIGVLKGIRDNSQANAKFLSIKPFGEFENANVIREIITAASVSIAPYKL